MSEAERRGIVRLLIILILSIFSFVWYLDGLVGAFRITGMLLIGCIIFSGIFILMYETEAVLEWLGKLKFQ